MTQKHTPGPWAFGSYAALLVVPVINGIPDKHQWIAHLGDTSFPYNATTDSEERYANAALIAAAPELLEALQGLLADITEYQTINHLGGENNHWQVFARAAIAKATGETK